MRGYSGCVGCRICLNSHKCKLIDVLNLKHFAKSELLHLFSDASRQGYSAVAYLRLVDVDGRVHCAFVMAISPSSRDLHNEVGNDSRCHLCIKLREIMREELDVAIQRVYYWTDTTSVLKCINNESKRFHTSESNLITIIHSESSPKEWRYVKRDGSKGWKLDTLLKDERWLKGPQFL